MVRAVSIRPSRTLLAALALVAGATLLAACWPQPASAYQLTGKRWPGRTPKIALWNGTGYDEEVRIAVRAWNTSGVRVRFVLVPRSRADVVMTSYKVSAGVLDGFGASGRASLGYSPFSYVRVSRGAKGAPIIGVIAHELGHVLGLAHSDDACGLMNTLPWLECGDPSCDLIQADDLRGALRRYGGRARTGRGELCPPAPRGIAIAPLPRTYRVQMTFDLPQQPAVTGYALRIGVGSCPDADAGPARTAIGTPGQSVLADVTPEDPTAIGKLLCVRLWTSGEKGRLSRTSATTSIPYAPDPLPPPSSLTASGIPGGANISWPAVDHSALVGYEVAFLAGASCPARPTDAPAGQRAGFTVAQAGGGVRMSAAPGRYCVGAWSRDGFGRYSASSATAVVDVPAS